MIRFNICTNQILNKFRIDIPLDKLHIYIILICVPVFLQAQINDTTKVKQEAKKHLELLSSKEMQGRGYIKDGHLQAAIYIAMEMREYGLEPINKNQTSYNPFFQKFSLDLHLLKNGYLKIGSKDLKIGEDFIINAHSAATKYESSSVVDITNKKISSGMRGKFWFYDKTVKHKKLEYELPDELLISKALEFGAAGVILAEKKLTAAISSKSHPIPIFNVLKSSIPKKVGHVKYYVNAIDTLVATQNVIGTIKGTEETDTTIILCAHYDHLGKVGDAIFYGANDNASGVSFLLTLAKYFSENPLKYNLTFIAFGAEETGLDGSIYYVQHPPKDLSKVKFVLNFDLMGNGEEGVMAVGGKTFKNLYQTFEKINDKSKTIPILKARENAPNSDHYPFTKMHVPALFFYTMGGAPHYHDIYDQANEIKLPVFIPFANLVIDFLNSY